jgi:hypothetical protein
LSKIEDYLIDNPCVYILSQFGTTAVKMKRGLAEEPVPKWESRWTARRREQLGVYPVVRRRDVS